MNGEQYDMGDVNRVIKFFNNFFIICYFLLDIWFYRVYITDINTEID